LLGYGTVGASVSRMLAESGDEIERVGKELRELAGVEGLLGAEANVSS
jgi:homoserine dehydrogenase